MLKFTRTKVDNLMGQTEVRFTEDEAKEFVVAATREGVAFRGNSPTISDRAELDEFARVLSLAWKEHRGLIPQFARTVSGH